MPIYAAMLQIAGAALGLWLVIPWLRAREWEVGNRPDVHWWLFSLVFVLGGFSLLGPPLLLVTARNRRWGVGRLLWFAYGTAAWVLWPPIIYNRINSAGWFGANCGSFFLPRGSRHGCLYDLCTSGRGKPEAISKAPAKTIVARDHGIDSRARLGVYMAVYDRNILQLRAVRSLSNREG